MKNKQHIDHNQLEYLNLGMPNKQTYIQDIQLSGYKSIKSVSCDFEEGLNIIIGNNGSGKSNLLEFIYQVLSRQYAGLGLFKADININREDKDSKKEIFNWHAESDIQTDVNGPNLQKIAISEPDLKNSFIIEFVRFNLPIKIEVISSEFNSKFDLGQRWLMFDSVEERIPTSILFWLQMLFFAQKKSDADFEKLNDDDLYRLLSDSFNASFEVTKKKINTYTPIEDIRVNKSVRIANIDSSTLEFRNIVLEYKMNNEWYSWNALSDGTKRLIYLIFTIEGIEIRNDSGGIIRGAFPITLIEEPELGIHPHQLHLILNYLKEKAKEQQIILTTHSPQVLDILETTELNKIIIAEIDFEKGTNLRHLNNDETKKTQAYFKDQGLLSDYWRFSDFQRTKNVK